MRCRDWQARLHGPPAIFVRSRSKTLGVTHLHRTRRQYAKERRYFGAYRTRRRCFLPELTALIRDNADGHGEDKFLNTGRASMRAMVFLLLAAMCFTVDNLQAQEIGSPHQGLTIARAVCADCHLVDKVPGRSPNVAAPTFEHIANTPGMTSAALTAALRTSHKTMPNVIIKGSDISDIVAYVLSLKGSD
jgi:mono/diheme cytochrome c family protein